HSVLQRPRLDPGTPSPTSTCSWTRFLLNSRPWQATMSDRCNRVRSPRWQEPCYVNLSWRSGYVGLRVVLQSFAIDAAQRWSEAVFRSGSYIKQHGDACRRRPDV